MSKATNPFHKRLASLTTSSEEKYWKRQNLTVQNTQTLNALKNEYANPQFDINEITSKTKRCFIVGSSPSLDLLDLSLLNNEKVFTVNRGFLLRNKGLLHSDFHVISDIQSVKDPSYHFELLEGFTDLLFCYGGMPSPDQVSLPVVYFDYMLAKFIDKPFQENIAEPLVAYQSVIHFAIQIAYYLEFNQIILLGVDLDFAKNLGHAYSETPGEQTRQMEHSCQMAQTMLDGVDKCGKWLSQHGVDLLNASPKGIVDCVRRVKYQELF